jgi:hypothetical protein
MSGYPSLDDAVSAALFEASRLSREHRSNPEYVGVIYEQDGQHFYTPPVSSGNTNAAKRSVHIPSGSARALYHNHPGRGAEDFTPQDISTSSRYGVPSYISVEDQNNEIRKWNPAAPSATKVKTGSLSRDVGNSFSRGEPVLAQLPWTEMKRHMMIELLGRKPDDSRGLTR